MDSSRTYTINEVAALTGLHKNTVRQRVRFGQLKAAILPGKYGEEYRISHAALVEAGLLQSDPLAPDDGDAVTVEFSPAVTPTAGPAAPEPLTPAAADGVGALRDLYQRHEQAMFRLGYMQGELDRVKALAESAESLRRDNEQRREEVDSLRTALAERERAEQAAREELESARTRLADLEALRQSLSGLKALAAEQEATIRTLESERPKRRRWFFGR
jgi:excisionase family DNA binding protein